MLLFIAVVYYSIFFFFFSHQYLFYKLIPDILL